MRVTVRVAAGVIVRDSRVLVCRRLSSDRHPGKWEFPGGKAEPGEGIDTCLRRELREELGVEALPGHELGRSRHQDGDLDIDLAFLLVDRLEGEPRNLRFAEMRWVAIEDLANYDLLPADCEFARRLARGEVGL